MKNINADIKNRTFKPVYLLYGEEEYLKNQYKKKLFEGIAGDDNMNTLVLDSKDVDLVKVRDFTSSFPFMAEYRTVLLTDTGLFAASSEDWAKYIDELEPTAIIIFVENKVDKRNKLYKTVKDKGYVCELNRPSEAELKNWIAGMLRKNDKVIRESVCEELILMAGDNMDNLSAQLHKIISYADDRQEITSEDINAVCTPEPQSQIFKMIEAAADGRTQVALDYYYDMLTLKEPAMRTLFMIGRQINQLLCIREMMADGRNSSDMAGRLKLQPFIVNKLMKQARAFEPEALKKHLEKCVENEELVKTGRMDDRVAVETVLIRLSKRVID